MFFENDESNNKTQNNQYIWAEKYRPNVLDDYLGNDEIKNSVSTYIESGEIPHLLFHSRAPGTGKTTVAKMIINSIKCDYLYINASDESRIDDMRDKVKGFASSLGFHKLKILILDEADRMSPASQMALRNIMETFSNHSRFILTCNYVDKLIEPIISRCQVFHVKPPSKAEVAKHVASILDKENVKYAVEDFKVLMKYYPDIRRIIQTAQQNSISGTLSVSESEVYDSDAKIKLMGLLKSSISKKEKLAEIRTLLMNNSVSDYSEYFDYLFDNVTEYAGNNTSNVILTLAEYQYKDAFVANKEINFAACLIEILKNM
jgi:DNA polymerase III delta prime subunit